jgi:peptide/nickel transport system substrate-binding protein
MRSLPKAALALAAVVVAAAAVSACRGDPEPRATAAPSAVLRVGVGAFSTTSAISGVRQLTQIVTVEGLARLLPNGRVEPWLADRWTLSDDGRSLIVTLKSGATFHDGSPADAPSVVRVLGESLRNTLGPVAEDVASVRAVDSHSLEIQFKRPSPFLIEALEVQVKKPGKGTIATGPFFSTDASTTELAAHRGYYGGKPAIDTIRLQVFPSVRAAWAELLRDRIDMLYEVGPDALDSLQGATNVAVFTFLRHYQYIVLLNAKVPVLRSTAIRQALNMAVDRSQLVAQALGGHGVPSTGVVSPAYWALPSANRPLEFDPKRASELLSSKHVRFTCLVPPDAIFERIALELKRQFAAVGVEVDFRSTTADEIFKAEENGSYEAILIETISGPTLLRPYQAWHSKGAVNVGGAFGNRTVDAAFEKARFAQTEGAYREAVGGVQQAFLDDPPAVFLAWSERARAISRRFDVPSAGPSRDILMTLRLWRPRNDQRFANRN